VIPLRRKLTAIAEQLQGDDVDAVLAERATEYERTSLAFADIRFSGVMLTALAARVEAEERGEDLPPLKRDPDAFARVLERIELRERLGLPDRDCYQRRPKKNCACLYDALDKADETATKASVLELAREEHERRSKTYTTLPAFEHLRPKPTEPKPSAPFVSSKKRKPTPAEVVTETSTRPEFRVVKRRPRWWDGPPGGGGIMDKVF
jgi:hypothetical protein